jgi:outer membrane protein TolC
MWDACRQIFWGCFVLAMLIGCVWNFSAMAEVAEKEIVLDLTESIARALPLSDEIHLSEAQIDAAVAKFAEVSAFQYPAITLQSTFGVIPGYSLNRENCEASCTANKLASDCSRYCTEQSHLNILDATQGDDDYFAQLGFFTKTELDIVQPLYTFGKLSAAKRAAHGGIALAQSQKNVQHNKIIRRMKKLYYGLLLAGQLEGVLKEASDKLRSAEEKVQEKLAKNAEDASQKDAMRLKIYRTTLQKQENALRKNKNLALQALHLSLAIPEDVTIALKDKKLPKDEIALRSEDEYVRMGLASRPEIQMAESGRVVTESLVTLAKSEFYPVFFVGGGLRYGYAPEIENIESPFISQPFRTLSFGAMIGARYEFDLIFKGKRAKLDQARSQQRQVDSKTELAQKGITLQIHRAYQELLEASSGIHVAEDGIRASRGWLTESSNSYDLGIGDAKELLEALGTYFKMRSDYYQSLFDYHMALATLTEAVGKELVTKAP